MSARIAGPLAWSVCVLSVTFSGLGILLLFVNGNWEHLLDESLGVDAVVGFVCFPNGRGYHSLAALGERGRLGQQFCSLL